MNEEIIKITEKLQVSRANKTTKDGRKYVYKTYKVFVRPELLEMFGIESYLYMYLEDGNVIITGARPDGSVPSKKLKVAKQKKDSKPATKRIIIIPRMFFHNIEEDYTVLFTLDKSRIERFSNVPAILTIDLIKNE